MFGPPTISEATGLAFKSGMPARVKGVSAGLSGLGLCSAQFLNPCGVARMTAIFYSGDIMRALFNFKPDKDDPLRIRRNLALLTVLYSFVFVPAALIVLTLAFKLPDTLAGNLLTYFGALTAGPLGAFALACHTADKQGGQNDGTSGS